MHLIAERRKDELQQREKERLYDKEERDADRALQIKRLELDEKRRAEDRADRIKERAEERAANEAARADQQALVLAIVGNMKKD